MTAMSDAEILDELKAADAIRSGHFVLTSGRPYNLGGKALITEWYDKDDDFRRDTKASGTYYIYKPRLSILAASTVQWLTQNCQESDLMGGFLPRWLFFHETKKDYILSVRDEPVEELWPELEEHVRRIKSHHGEVKLSGGAFDYYWDWRREIEDYARDSTRGVRTQAADGLQAVEEGTRKVLDRGGNALRRAEDVLQDTKAQVGDALRRGQEAIRPTPSP